MRHRLHDYRIVVLRHTTRCWRCRKRMPAGTEARQVTTLISFRTTYQHTSRRIG